METKKILVTGTVQGVGYRAWTKWLARKLGVRGWVRNQSDGSVEILALGTKETLQEFINACHTGPPLARVDTVTLSVESTPADLVNFMVIKDNV